MQSLTRPNKINHSFQNKNMKYLILPVLRLLWFIYVTIYAVFSILISCSISLLLTLWFFQWYFSKSDVKRIWVINDDMEWSGRHYRSIYLFWIYDKQGYKKKKNDSNVHQ